MGKKQKSGRIFGRGLGRHRKVKRERHTGKPVYRISKIGGKNKHKNLKLKIQKLKEKAVISIQQHTVNSSVYAAFPTESELKLKIRKVKHLCHKGYRFMNLDCLQAHVSDITLHVCLCPDAISVAAEGKSPIKLETEVRSYGLASIMMAQCQGCKKEFRLESSPRVPGSKRFDVNVRAVWGSMVTGNGPAHLNEFLATMNSPGLTQASFSAIETEIGKWWHSVLEKEMLAAGQEERQLAIDRNDFHQEVPAISVITDGGWSKRTHKHSYNAAGGVAIIIGAETKKLLHVGVRNKYCYICNVSGAGEGKKEHVCFKNWDQDSQSMEGDIILEGFLQAESKHGVRFMRIIGDGDSSVFARIREEVPVWGRFVAKQECANHVCKCYRSNLEKLVSDNPLYKGKHHLSKTTRVRLVSALRCAIRMRSKEYEEGKTDKATATKKLTHDIKNSVHHVFGLHTDCSDFCRAKPSQQHQTSSRDSDTSKTTNTGTSSTTVIEQQIDFWTNGSSIQSQEESRNGTCLDYSNVEQHIIKDVTTLLLRIAEKSDRLLGNSTTNLAECWMRIRTKFDGGKVHNLCNRSSWHARCYGGALRMNLGPQWSCKVWESSTATEPGYFFRKQYARQEQTLSNATKYRLKPETQKLRWKKKISSLKQSTSKKARKAYGPEATDVTNDVTSTELETLKQTFLENQINRSDTQCKNITASTIQQSQSGIWHSERRKRITASNFGCIIKRNPTLPVQKIVNNFLYSSFRGKRHTRNGILQEDTTIEEYKLKKADEKDNVTVSRSGLVIHPHYKFLAGSPDGIVYTPSGESGLIEIKNLLHSKPLNLWQASKNSTFCLETLHGKMSLKTNHNYFYQCQGLLQICDKKWIDFVVRTLNPYQLFVDNLWQHNMLPKLRSFYHKALLPELAAPRQGKCPGIREPGIWFEQSTRRKQSRHTCKQRRARSTCSSKRRRRALKPSSSSDVNSADAEPSDAAPSRPKRRKQTPTKFLGRCIRHEWVIDEDSQQKEWYKGTVISILSGTDGDVNAVYEVLYDGDDDAYEIDHLIQDYRSGSVELCDV